MGCFCSLLRFFLRLGFLAFSLRAPLVRSVLFFQLSHSLYELSSLPFFIFFAALLMARTKITPNPPSFSQNPAPKTRRVITSSSRNPSRNPSIPSSQAERPASSRPNQPQPTPPQTCVAVRPLPDYKQLYPWATSTLLGETSSINTDIDVLRLKKGDKAHLVPLENPSAPTTRGAMVNPSASSMPPCSRRLSSASPSLASRGSS